MMIKNFQSWNLLFLQFTNGLELIRELNPNPKLKYLLLECFVQIEWLTVTLTIPNTKRFIYRTGYQYFALMYYWYKLNSMGNFSNSTNQNTQTWFSLENSVNYIHFNFNLLIIYVLRDGTFRLFPPFNP